MQPAAQEPLMPEGEDAPMGSDHGDLDDEDFVYADDNEMAQLEAQADEDEAEAMLEGADQVDDFETYQESEFGEGDEYEDG